MKVTTSTIAFILVLFIRLNSFGQDFQVAVEGQTRWVKLSQTGVLLVLTNEGLCGVDPVSKSVLWKNPTILNADESGIELIDQAPLVLLKTFSGNKTWLVDTYSGKLIFDSEASGFDNINKKFMCIENGVLLVDVNKENERALVAVDIAQEGAIKWEIPMGKKMSTLIDWGDLPRPLEQGTSLLYPMRKELMKIDLEKGEIRWQKEFKKNIRILSMRNENLLVFSGSTTEYFDKAPTGNFSGLGSTPMTGSNFMVSLLSTSDGGDIWEPVSIKGAIANIYEMEDGMLIFNDAGDLPKIDLDNGSMVWNKPPSVKAAWVFCFTEVDNGYLMSPLAVSQNMVYHIDKEGNEVCKPYYKSGRPIKVIQPTSKGIFVIGSNFDLLETESKKSMWAKSVDAGFVSTFTRDDQGNYYILTSSGAMFYVDMAEVSYKQLASGLPVGVSSVLGMELSEEGIIIDMAQGMVATDLEGKLKWSKHYPVLELSAGMQFLMAGISTAATVHSATMDAASLGSSLSGNSRAAAASNGMSSVSAGVADQAAGMMNKRFEASENAADYKVFLTQNQSSKPGLVIVNKKDGSEKFIELDSRTPAFALDPVEKLLYVVFDKSTVKAFKVG